jgi:hypothetical protein
MLVGTPLWKRLGRLSQCNRNARLRVRLPLPRISQIVFLLFYVASSYAITQERTSLIVSELYHSSSRSNQFEFDSGCEQLRNGFPNFQRANPKTICALQIGRKLNVNSISPISQPAFPVQLRSLKSLYSAESILDRAPPSDC